MIGHHIRCISMKWKSSKCILKEWWKIEAPNLNWVDILTWLYSKYKTEAQADISLLICVFGGLWIGLFWPNWPLFGDDANEDPDEEKGLFWWNTSCCCPGKTFCDEFGENWFENGISWGDCELVSWSRECVLTVGFCKTGAGWRNWARNNLTWF